ncbi:DNA repair exonuclease [Lapidilactobacillus wuchangensis]|uniref:DNA repair exonuclease n=1 Tax=Lapidilactobacillus wuchangensis TaxID=2486001 RepID=UPI000F7693E7|nr:DNA repair exonuclease [Lapidilactobacillus wuchangensis]
MTKIVQMSDVHLGFAYAGLTDRHRQQQRQQDLWQTFLNALAYCQKIDAQLLLIPGDLFDTPNPDAALVQDVQDAFRKIAPIKVVIATGNHDFAYAGSCWDEPQKWPANVHLFTGTWSKLDFPDWQITIWGAGFTAPYAKISLLKPVTPQTNHWQIGVLHGDAFTPESSPYDPLTAEQIANSGLNWLALGHIHKRIQNQVGATAYAYAGTPEGHGFDEQGPKGVLVLDFIPGQTTPTVTFQPLAQRQYEELSVDLTGLNSNSEAAAKIETMLAEKYGPDYQRHLYKIHLTGALPTTALITEAGLTAQLSVFDLRLRNETHLAIDYQQLAQLDTLAGNFTKKVLAKIDQAHNDQEKAQAQLALDLGLRAFQEDLTNAH